MTEVNAVVFAIDRQSGEIHGRTFSLHVKNNIPEYRFWEIMLRQSGLPVAMEDLYENYHMPILDMEFRCRGASVDIDNPRYRSRYRLEYTGINFIGMDFTPAGELPEYEADDSDVCPY